MRDWKMEMRLRLKVPIRNALKRLKLQENSIICFSLIQALEVNSTGH